MVSTGVCRCVVSAAVADGAKDFYCLPIPFDLLERQPQQLQQQVFTGIYIIQRLVRDKAGKHTHLQAQPKAAEARKPFARHLTVIYELADGLGPQPRCAPLKPLKLMHSCHSL